MRWKVMTSPMTGMLRMMIEECWTDSRPSLSGTRESLVRVAQVYDRPTPTMFNSPADRG